MDTSSVDLLALIGRDVTLRKRSNRTGGEWAGPCPFCPGNHGDGPKADRLSVWPKGKKPNWRCWSCGRSGDAITYVQRRFHLSFGEALDRLGLTDENHDAEIESASSVGRVISPKHDPAEPPSQLWQARGTAFCQEAEDRLWRPEGAKALTWLHKVRGLTRETILAASLGYNPVDLWDDREAWGLLPETYEDGKPKRVWLPRGVVIPWQIKGVLWRVNVRRPAGEPKYMGPAGWSNSLYEADDLITGAPAVLLEGELDRLSVNQCAGDIISAVATGSTQGARRVRWLAKLAACSRVLIAYDSDEAGEEAAKYWLNALSNARRWRAYYGKDANGMATAGGNLRAWVEAGLRGA